MSNVPSLEVSKWNHSCPKGGIVFTAKHETEVIISPMDMLLCIADQTCSKSLSGMLNELSKCYDSSNGSFTIAYSVNDLTQVAKDFIAYLYYSIEDSEK